MTWPFWRFAGLRLRVYTALADRLMADLLAAGADRTVVIVSHRADSITGADEVLTLADGAVIRREVAATPSHPAKTGTLFPTSVATTVLS